MRALSVDQKRAVDKLGRLTVGALFMACGTGKTQTAVAWVNSIPELDLLVWFCPCRCRENTAEELAKCGLRYTPRVFGIESMSASERAYREVRDLLDSVPANKACIVMDESLTIKNPTSKRTKRITDLGRKARYKLILNGTPVTKNILDIWGQMNFLSPLILNCNYSQFRDRYCEYTTIRKFGRIVRQTVEGSANEEHLLALIEPYTYTCNLELDVDQKYYTHEGCLSDEEIEEYEEVKQTLIEEYSRGRETNMGAVFAKIQHAYCLAPVKFDILDNLLVDEDGHDLTHNTLVFCKFIDSEEALKRAYPELRVLTYGKGSIGLNLQTYNRIIYFDKTFDYAFREQSEARIYRRGQQHTCEYHDITMNVAVDRIIDACISRKSDLLDVFMRRGSPVSRGNLKALLDRYEDHGKKVKSR